MMNLLLVQHGQVKTEAEDPTRSLNTVGIDTSEKVARWLAASKVNITEIRHSGKRCTEQRALIFAKQLSLLRGVKAIAKAIERKTKLFFYFKGGADGFPP